MNQGELAAFIDTHLRDKEIQVILSRGASVAIYSNYQYVSKDLDFIAWSYMIIEEDWFTPKRFGVRRPLILPEDQSSGE